MDAATKTEQAANGTAAAPKQLLEKRKSERKGDDTLRLRVEGSIVEINFRKLTGLEMRTVETMAGRPTREAADWARRGSPPCLLAFLYVAFDRQGFDVGTPDEFLEKWDIDRIDALEPVEDPTPAVADESAAAELAEIPSSTDSDGTGSAPTGDPNTQGSTE